MNVFYLLFKKIKHILDLIISNDKFCKIYQLCNFDKELEELLSIATYANSKVDKSKLNPKQYLLGVNIMFNTRLLIYDISENSYDILKQKIEFYDQYFNGLFKKHDFENNKIRRQFSRFNTKWSFPIEQSRYFYFEEGIEFNILSNKDVNFHVFEKIQNDFKYNKLDFYNKKDWIYACLKFFFALIFLSIPILLISIAIKSLMDKSANTIDTIYIIATVVFLIFPINFLYKYRYKNYKYYIPIVFSFGRGMIYPSLILNHFVLLTVILIAYIYPIFSFVNLMLNYELKQIDLIIYVILLVLTILFIGLLIYISLHRTKVDYDLIIKLYDQYYSEIWYQAYNKVQNIQC